MSVPIDAMPMKIVSLGRGMEIGKAHATSNLELVEGCFSLGQFQEQKCVGD